MALIFVIQHEDLVGLVLVDAKFGEGLVLLDVGGRETQSFGDVPNAVLLSRAKV